MNTFFSIWAKLILKKQISEKLLAIEMRKTQMNKPVFLGFSKHDFSKIQMCKSCYDFIKENIIKNKIMINWHYR